MNLGSLDPALTCSGMMSNFSYDSHPVSRRRTEDELPRGRAVNSSDRWFSLKFGLGWGSLSAWINFMSHFRYTKQQMDLEIQRVAREMFKAFSGMNKEFEDVSLSFWLLQCHTNCAGQGPDSDRWAELSHRHRAPGVDPSIQGEEGMMNNALIMLTCSCADPVWQKS